MTQPAARSNAARWLITGGLGFIGSHFVRLVLSERPDVDVINLDAVTYAGNRANLADVEEHERYRFFRGDIADAGDVRKAIGAGVDAIVNFAAESHVDRSLCDSEPFERTNVLGVATLLEAAREHGVTRFLQVSTDEIYGPAAERQSFRESDPMSPRNPYSESKAKAERLVTEAFSRHGLPALLTRGSNSYGPYQYPEKLIPLFITNLIEDEPVPVYGDGLQVRDWLHVEDHARGILHVLERGVPGEVYNLGAGNHRTNLEVALRLAAAFERSATTHIRHVKDRLNHDRRYSMVSTKAHALGWRPRVTFDAGLNETIAWYRANDGWWRPLRTDQDREATA